MQTERTIPAYNTHRTFEKFLWLPLSITTGNDDRTKTVVTRWLMTVRIEQKWTKGRVGDFWQNKRFL